MAKAAQQLKEPVQEELLKEEAPVEQAENELPLDQEVEVQLDAPEVEVGAEDPSAALQKQLEALKKSEELYKSRTERLQREVEEARQLAQTHETEAGKSRKEVLQSQFDAISTALAASKSEVESAKRDIRVAISNGDPDAQTEAFERLSRAQANIANLENGRIEVESRLKQPHPPPTPQNTMPDRARRWIASHQDYMTDPDKNADLQYIHRKLMRQGIEFDSDEYVEKLEIELGLRQAAAEEEVVPQPKPKATVAKIPVSAPVSREAPSTPDGDRGGVVRLSPAQREAARIAGVSEKDYAIQLAKIQKQKANGSYGGQI
jgi:hypothetical protein